MKRISTLATTGLFTAGLAVLPMTVFAQPSAPSGTDTKAATTSHSMPSDAKATPSNKDSATTKDSGKVTGPKVGSAPAGNTAKPTGNHDKGA